MFKYLCERIPFSVVLFILSTMDKARIPKNFYVVELFGLQLDVLLLIAGKHTNISERHLFVSNI